MASIRETKTGKTVAFEGNLSVGRATGSGLHLGERHVSGEHAVIVWRGDAWMVQDCGSRNGTYVDGKRIVGGVRVALDVGATLSFGARSSEWVLVDDAGPRCAAEPVDGGDPIVMRRGLLALPSDDDPQVTVYEHRWGGWVVERPGEPDQDGEAVRVVRAGDRTFFLRCPATAHAKRFAHPIHTPPLSMVVSNDGECLEVRLGAPERPFVMRACDEDYLLLALVRRVLACRRGDGRDWDRGWMYEDRAPPRPDGQPRRVDLDVFRLRRRAAAAGLRYPADIVLRHAETRQLRVGAAHVSLWVRGARGKEELALSSSFMKTGLE